jgi:hypothetical protein
LGSATAARAAQHSGTAALRELNVGPAAHGGGVIADVDMLGLLVHRLRGYGRVAHRVLSRPRLSVEVAWEALGFEELLS